MVSDFWLVSHCFLGVRCRYKAGFGLEMVDANCLLLTWKSQGLVATSAWNVED